MILDEEDRPSRDYAFTFHNILHGGAHSIVTSGCTPCRARNAAYVSLQQDVKSEGLPAEGWVLLHTKDLGYTPDPS